MAVPRLRVDAMVGQGAGVAAPAICSRRFRSPLLALRNRAGAERRTGTCRCVIAARIASATRAGCPSLRGGLPAVLLAGAVAHRYEARAVSLIGKRRRSSYRARSQLAHAGAQSHL